MADSEDSSSSYFALGALVLALIGAASLLYYQQVLFLPRAQQANAARGLRGYAFGNDFYPVWLTARRSLQQHSDPYSPEMTREIQKGLFGRPLDSQAATDPRDRRTFVHPAFTLLLLWPVAELPFAVARVGMFLLLAALTIASVLLWLSAISWRVSWQLLAVASLLTLCSYPALEGLYAGQLGLLVAFLLATSIFAVRRGRLFLSGILLALAMLKPQMTVLVAMYLLLWAFRQWRVRASFGAGFFSTSLLMVGAALAVWPQWIQSWVQVLVQYHDYTRPPLVAEVLAMPLGSRLAGPATVLLIAGALIFAVVLAWNHRDVAIESPAFLLTVSLLLVITTLALLPGQAIYDHVILLPGILLLARYRREVRAAGRVARLLVPIGALVLFWPWLAAFALVVLRLLLTPATLNSAAVLSLPIRTAASLPFVVLVLLAYVLRISPRGNPESV